MNIIQKILGLFIIASGFYAGYYIVVTLAIPKFDGKPEDIIPGIIYLFLTPIISLALVVFGYYAVTGEYSKKKA